MDSFQGLQFPGGGRGDLQQPQQNPFPNPFNYSYPLPPPPPSHLHHHYPSPPAPPPPPISSQHQPPPPPPPQQQHWGHLDGHLQQQHHHPPLPSAYPPTAAPPYAAQPMPHHQYPPQTLSLPASHHALPPLSHHHPLPTPSPPPSAYPPPPHQGWGGPSWGQHQGWEYADRYIPYNTEDDWAARAKAWAASTAVIDNHQTHSQAVPDGRMEAHSSTYHDQYQAATNPPSSTLQPSLSQSTNQQFPSYSLDQQKQANHLQGSAPFLSGLTSYAADSRLHYNNGEEVAPYKDHNSPAKNLVSSSSIYGQEVSYNYSSIPVDQQDFTDGRQPSDYATDASNKPLDFEPRLTELEMHPKIGYGPDPSTGVTDQDAIAISMNPWAPPIAPRVLSQTSIVESVTQPALGSHTSAVYGRISGPNFMPGVSPVNPPFGLVTSASRNPAMILPADANSPFALPDRPKKAAVPNWLREEIIKNKTVIASTYAGNQSGNSSNSMGSEDDDKLNKKSVQVDNNSIDSTKSTDDEEDDAEVARSAAINQEIKRVLTEVLLKVTDELIYEIAMKVLNEEDQTDEVPGYKENGNQKVPFPVVSTPKASTNVPVTVKENITDNGVNESSTLPSPSGNLLGLASYASDEDDDDDVGIQNSELFVRESNRRSSGNAPKNVETQSVLPNKGRSFRDQDNDVSQRVEPNDTSKNSNARNHADKSASLDASLADGKLCSRGKEHIAPQSKGKTTSKSDMNSHDVSASSRSWESASTVDPVRELKNTISSSRHTEKKSYSKDYVKKETTVMDKSNSESSNETINHENKIRLKENINKRYNQEIFEEEIVKRGANAKDYGSRSHDSIKDKMGTLKDKKEKEKVDTERHKEKLRGEDDNSRQIIKESKYNRRSPSPSHRGRHEKESEVSKKRRLQSRSPSPTRSRNRQVSRSPHRKHSHRRHSPYSSDRRRTMSSSSPHRRR